MRELSVKLSWRTRLYMLQHSNRLNSPVHELKLKLGLTIAEVCYVSVNVCHVSYTRVFLYKLWHWN